MRFSFLALTPIKLSRPRRTLRALLGKLMECLADEYGPGNGLREDKNAKGSRARAFGGVAKVNFYGVSQSDLYPVLAGNVKLVKPSELPIMSARDNLAT
jgi:hypothetical protein